MRTCRFRYHALCLILAVLFCAGTTFCKDTITENDSRLHKMAQERWHTWRRNRKTFPIAAWSYFHRYTVTRPEFEKYRDANMTMVMPTPEQYESAVSTGLETILGHFKPLHEDSALLKKMVEFPTPENRSVTAYILKDEPLVEDFPAVSNAVEYIYENDRRDAIPIIDFRPNWSVPYKRWNMTYETYLQRFIDEVHPCVLLNCHYPIMRNGTTRPIYYANMEWFRRKALEYDIGLMGFVLVTSHTYPENPEIDYREPSESDLRWLVYCHLAYGAKGIWYYNWRIQKTDRFGDSMLDWETGEPTNTYSMVADVNREILAIGETILKLRSTGVYHTGKEVPPGTTRFTEGFVQAIHIWSGDNFIISEFENRDDRSDKDVYIMIVNKRHEAEKSSADLSARARFFVYPDYSEVHCYNPQAGNTYSLRRLNGKYFLELNGGQGVLLRFEKKKDKG